ncbi:MAG: alpha-galactosidase [Clostridiales bacterium]|nr:alpha-galactosidase [Clostridiales bacterium]
MSVLFNECNGIFNLKTKNSSYLMGILMGKHLVHLYYGKRIDNVFGNAEELIPTRCTAGFSPNDIDGSCSSDILPMEYPCYGSADLRTPAFHAQYENGSAITKLEYEAHKVFGGKKKLEGLPAVYTESEDEAETLEITLIDRLTNLRIVLSYSVFEELDAIVKSVKVINDGGGVVRLKSVLSSCTYLFSKEYDFVHLDGAWARERHIERQPLRHGIAAVDSKRVASSHHHSPFAAYAEHNADERQGEVYGYSFVYSGNFIASAETDQFDTVRCQMGINPFGFEWRLESGESFQTPEVVCVFSDKGFGEMSRTFHKLYRTRLVRGMYRDMERPILINNWEATYFNFDEDKIFNIAKKASEAGIEMMVLDDGWFGHRDDDRSSLGDWFTDTRKLPNGIEGIAKRVTDIGMKFGLWFEPEMISKDSELYKVHPDWCLHVESRERTEGRWQLVLDLSRADVRDYIVNIVSGILKSAPISYVKWDMNRNISELGSADLCAECQPELAHRYILGLYDICERITTAFPEVLFEGCSGGGGRFDAGLMYYFQQYWTSDDTDAIERQYIQYGTSMVMPASAMGAHVSAVPNHQVGRVTPLKTRGYAAMMGQFGYELDIEKLNDDEIETIKGQIEEYKSIREIIHKGSMYRLKSPFEGQSSAWEFVSEDKSEVVLIHFTILASPQLPLECVRAEGLDAHGIYIDKATNKEYSGEFLMNRGIYFDNRQDFECELIRFSRKAVRGK